MEARHVLAGAPLVAAYVFLSSLLGLAGTFLLVAPADAFQFMWEVWSQSIVADAVFTIGMVLAAILAFGLARRTNAGYGIAIGAAASWLVYFASFVLLPESVNAYEVQSLFEAFRFVGGWGAIGLVFSGLAPPLLARWWERRERSLEAGTPA